MILHRNHRKSNESDPSYLDPVPINYPVTLSWWRGSALIGLFNKGLVCKRIDIIVIVEVVDCFVPAVFRLGIAHVVIVGSCEISVIVIFIEPDAVIFFFESVKESL